MKTSYGLYKRQPPPHPLPGEAFLAFQCEGCERVCVRFSTGERLPLVCARCAEERRFIGRRVRL